MEEQIDSLVITRISTEGWTYTVNGLLGAEDAYTGSITAGTDFLTIKSLNGAPQVVKAAYTVISYVDNLDGTKSRASFDSVSEAFFYLLEQGFYVGSSGTGGGGVTTLFKALLDVGVPTFVGNELKYVRVNSDGTLLEVVDNPASGIRLQDLSNWDGGEELLPNMAIVTTTSELIGGFNGIGQASLVNIINRPARYNEFQIWKKGFQVIDNTIVWNLEDYIIEIGDVVVPIWDDTTGETVPKLVFGRYLGGNPLDAENIDWYQRVDFGDTLI